MAETTSTRGRGRGTRGRGRGRISGPAAPLRRPGEAPKEAKNEEDMFGELANLIKDFTIKPSNTLLCRDITVKFEAYCTTDSNLQKVVEHLCQTGCNGEVAEPVAQIANKLISLENTGAKFRGPFLNRTQNLYESRKIMRKKSLEEWIGLACFICQTFNVVKMFDAPLRPLTEAAHQVLTELLTVEGRSDGEVDCFKQQFRTVGKTLQSVDQVKMEELVKTIRDTLIKDENSSPQARCLLLEMLELYWSGWNLTQDVDMSNSRKRRKRWYFQTAQKRLKHNT